MVNATLTYDLGSLVKGLKFQSYAGLNLFNMTRIGKNPDYTAVIYDPATGESVKTSHEGHARCRASPTWGSGPTRASTCTKS